MKSMFDFEIGKNTYHIVPSDHAVARMSERKITDDQIIDNVLSLSTNQVKELTRDESEVIIIDKENGVSIVAGFNKKGIITIITVINKKNPFIKRNTLAINI